MQNPLHIVYQDADYIFGRKPHGLASARGPKESFLEILQNTGPKSKQWSHQLRVFTKAEEYGLLNRLDNVTAGLLYFARSDEAKERYEVLQKDGEIQKIYYAQVYGRPSGLFGWIEDPIYHHRFSSDRMTSDGKRGRDKQEASTYWELVEDLSQGFSYSHENQHSSLLRVVITCGVRHQIRLHLASIGCPIVGDWLYMTKYQRKKYAVTKPRERIELFSVGVKR